MDGSAVMCRRCWSRLPARIRRDIRGVLDFRREAKRAGDPWPEGLRFLHAALEDARRFFVGDVERGSDGPRRSCGT